MKYFKYSLLAISLVFFSLNFIDFNIVEERNFPAREEKYDPSLVKLNTLKKLEAHVDSIALSGKVIPGSLEYAVIAKNIISERFYHKYATHDLNENWIASFTQKITGLYLSSKITANDILTKPYGYCGQQNTVLMELLQKKGVDCRVVYLPHHFVIQAHINDQWQYFDANAEPDIPLNQRANEKWLQDSDSLAIAYRKDVQWVNEVFGNPVNFKFGKVNEKQGPNAQIFQGVTKWMSKIAFLFPLLWFVYLNRNKQRAVATIHSK